MHADFTHLYESLTPRSLAHCLTKNTSCLSLGKVRGNAESKLIGAVEERSRACRL